MTKDGKLAVGIGIIAAIGFLYLVSQHSGTITSVDSNNPANTPLPSVAPITPNPSTFVLPGGSYVPQAASGGGCGCTMPGTNNATSNFLPASETAFTDLVAASGVDPSALNSTILAAANQTDFFPQTSSLAQMVISGGPGSYPS
jgi:hypothetical protein